MSLELLKFINRKHFRKAIFFGILFPIVTILFTIATVVIKVPIPEVAFLVFYPIIWANKTFPNPNCDSCISTKGIIIGCVSCYVFYTVCFYLILATSEKIKTIFEK